MRPIVRTIRGTDNSVTVDQRVCGEYVSRDIPEGNPFRNLLPQAGAHPLLQNTIVATSAIHMSHFLRPPSCRSGNDNGGLAALGSDERCQRAYRHALAAKHKALGMMRDAVVNIHLVDCGAVLASVFFLVDLELMEPGRVSWKAHLKGAGKILSLFQPTLARAGPLADYISADYLIYVIMASVFMTSPAFDTDSFFRPSPFPKMLKRAAAYSHICCPPEILNVLLAAATLSNTPCDASDNEQTITAASTLFESAYTFDVDAWARDEDNFSYLRSATVQTRIHAGHAHRLAACLYILRAIPAMNSLQDSDMVAKLLASNAIQHISSIPDDDANLKVITWPTFVVGADSDDAARREWAMGRLRQLATYWPWGFLYNAMDTLERLWCLDYDKSSGRSWVHVVKESDSDFLIV
ncbi:hypothetical protein NHJ6243_009715 [Beauveria neobassiana]